MVLRYRAPASTLTRASIDHTLLHRVQFSGGAVTTAWTVSAVSQDLRDGTRSSNVVVPPEYLYDSGQLLRTSVTVRNLAPWIRVHATEGTTRYSSFQALMRAQELMGSTVSMIRAFRAGGTTEADTAILGRVVAITKQTAATTTLEIEQRRELGLALVPQGIIDRSRVTTPTVLDPDAEGQAVPMPFGRFLPYLPPAIYGGLSDAGAALMAKFGLQPNPWPALVVERNAFDVVALYGEQIVGGRQIPHDADGAMSVWIDDIGAYATLFEGATIDGSDNIAFPSVSSKWEDLGQYATMVRAPYMQVPVRASEHFGDMGTPTPAKDPEMAIDGRPETGATIYYSATGFNVWQIPSVRKVGRITYNSRLQSTTDTDPDCFERPGPPGILGYAIVAIDSGTANVDVRIRLMDVHATLADSVFTMPVLGTLHSLTLVAGVPQLITMDIPVTKNDGSVLEGWNGTKWEDWDFSTDVEGNASVSGRVDQIGIGIAHRSSGAAPIKLIDIGLFVSFRYDERYLKFKSKFIGEQIANESAPVIDNRRSGRRRVGGRNSTVRRRRAGAASPYFGELYSSGRGGYRDTAAGLYTGTASKVLVSPVSFGHYLIDAYGRKTVVTSGLGSVSQARTDLDMWADWAHRGAGTGAWSTDHIVTEQTDVDSMLDDIGPMMPEQSQILKLSSNYTFHVWIPREASWTKWRNGTALHPQHILPGDEGLSLQLGTLDEDSVVNEIVVRYDYDIAAGKYRRTATCSLSGSDDGYGDSWAATPTGAVPAEDICQASYAIYGTRRMEVEYRGVRDPDVATALGLAILYRRHRPPVVLEMTASMHCYDLRPWYMFRFDDDLESLWKQVPSFWPDGTTWESLWWRVVASEQPQGFPPSMTIRAEWIPTESQITLGIALAGSESAGEDIGDLDFPLEGP